jgi:aryl-alcohol dehydrogenase-like predicted oxidoreductase
VPGEWTLSDRNLQIADAVIAIAARHGVEASQVAIAWLLAQRDQGVVVPIVGARTVEQMRINLGALEVELTAGDLAALEDASRIELGFPHDFESMGLAYGDTFPLVDSHH